MRRLALFAAIVALAVPSPGAASTRNETYVAGPLGDADGLCRHDTPAPAQAANVGAVCFVNIGSFGSVRVTVADTAPWRVGYWAGFVRSNGSLVSGRWYCPSASQQISVPGGAAKMYVYIGGARAPIEACTNDVGAGTNGTVTAVFS